MVPRGSNLQKSRKSDYLQDKIPVSSIKEKENNKKRKGTNHCYTQQLGMMLSNLSMQFKSDILYESIYVEFLIRNHHLLSQCPRGVLVAMGQQLQQSVQPEPHGSMHGASNNCGSCATSLLIMYWVNINVVVAGGENEGENTMSLQWDYGVRISKQIRVREQLLLKTHNIRFKDNKDSEKTAQYELNETEKVSWKR